MAARRPGLVRRSLIRANAACGERRSLAESLEELAGVDAATGLMEQAAVLSGASQAVREAIGAPILGPDLPRFQKAVAEVRLALGEGPFTAAERRGRAMSEADAVALARSEPAGPPTDVNYP